MFVVQACIDDVEQDRYYLPVGYFRLIASVGILINVHKLPLL